MRKGLWGLHIVKTYIGGAKFVLGKNQLYLMLVSVTFLSNLKQTILLSQVKIIVIKSCSQKLFYFIGERDRLFDLMDCFLEIKLNSENIAFMSYVFDKDLYLV